MRPRKNVKKIKLNLFAILYTIALLAYPVYYATASWHTFGTETGTVPLSYLDDNFALVQPLLISANNIKTINGASLLGSSDIILQTLLVSGNNIKTINGASLLGSGNIDVQPTLISANNIKTINGVSLLGSGNIAISGTGDIVSPHATVTNGGIVTFDGTGSYLVKDSLSTIGANTIIGANLTLTANDITKLSGIATGAELSVVRQIKNYQLATMSTGTGVIPKDNTIPQQTEGDEIMTLAITPTSATSKLRIEVMVNASAVGTNHYLTVALFQDATASAKAATIQSTNASGMIQNIPLTFYVTSGTTSATTFKVRIGVVNTSVDTWTLNGIAGVGLFNGTFYSSITITEYTP